MPDNNSSTSQTKGSVNGLPAFNGSKLPPSKLPPGKLLPQAKSLPSGKSTPKTDSSSAPKVSLPQKLPSLGGVDLSKSPAIPAPTAVASVADAASAGSESAEKVKIASHPTVPDPPKLPLPLSVPEAPKAVESSATTEVPSPPSFRSINPSGDTDTFEAGEQTQAIPVSLGEEAASSVSERPPLNLVIREDGTDLSGDFESDGFEDDGNDATEILNNPNAYLEQENRWESADLESLPKPGDKIAHYEVISEVGRGGFGAVYKVRNLVLDREEALKLILPDAKSDIQDIDKRFEREINIVSRLEHPNVVRLYSSGKLDHNILWMSMELIRGELLGSIMDRDGAMPFFRAKNIMLQILSGLQDAHELEIVHRDLKPSNVMISKRKGYDELVYILDFGLSKAIGNSEDASVQNVTSNIARSIYGTPNYMAPEQFAATGDLSPGVDVYAAGIIFLELLTGVHAFNGSVFEIAVKQQTAPVPIPDHLKNTAIEAVIKKACQKNSLLRYQTAGEFYDALSRIKSITDPPEVLTKPADSIDHTLETQFLKQPEFESGFWGQIRLEPIDAIHADLLKQWPFLDRLLFYVVPVLLFLLFVFFIILILT